MQEAPTNNSTEIIKVEEPKKLRKPKRHGYKLLDSYEQNYLVQMLGRYESKRDVERWLVSRGKNCDAGSMIDRYSHSEKWKPLIEKYRASFNQQLCNVPVANKARRLWELNEIFGKLQDLEERGQDPRDKALAIGLQMKVLTQAQDELEGKGAPSEQTNVYFTQFNNMSREEFDKWRLNLADRVQKYKTPEIVEVVSEQST